MSAETKARLLAKGLGSEAWALGLKLASVTAKLLAEDLACDKLIQAKALAPMLNELLIELENAIIREAAREEAAEAKKMQDMQSNAEETRT